MEGESSNLSELTHAKQVLNQDSNETKILGLGRNKQNYTLSVVTPTIKNNHQLTKRNILSELASVYDQTVLISPAHVIGKILYREIKVNSVDLHIFGNASIFGYCAVAYAVFSQPSKVN